jgi:menaquinol-cytochrome c reductase iron-sulfur subunit
MKPFESNQTATGGAERRSFLTVVAAMISGAIVALFPFAAGWGVATDPWLRSRRSDEASGDSNAAESTGATFIPICSLDVLEANGVPRAFPVISDIVDAWTRDTNQRIGMIFLDRTTVGGKPHVIAFSAECPHLGCFVDYNAAAGNFECPCHKSAFAKDGKQLYGPSRRGLDELKVRLDTKGDQTEVLVAFQTFQAGIAERKPIG